MGTVLHKSAHQEHSERGAAALELALVLPVLLLLLYAIVQFGTIFLIRQDLTEATADAARSSVTVPQSMAASTALTQVSGDISNDSAGLISVSPLSPCPSSGGPLTCSATAVPCPPGAPAGANCLTVTVTYRYDQKPVLPDLLGIPLPSVTVSSTVVLAGTGGLSS